MSKVCILRVCELNSVTAEHNLIAEDCETIRGNADVVFQRFSSHGTLGKIVKTTALNKEKKFAEKACHQTVPACDQKLSPC